MRQMPLLEMARHAEHHAQMHEHPRLEGATVWAEQGPATAETPAVPARNMDNAPGAHPDEFESRVGVRVRPVSQLRMVRGVTPR